MYLDDDVILLGIEGDVEFSCERYASESLICSVSHDLRVQRISAFVVKGYFVCGVQCSFEVSVRDWEC